MAKRWRMAGARRLARVGGLGGQWMLLEPYEYVQGAIYWNGVWEPHVSAWLAEQLTAGSVFVDVGANVGYFTLLAAPRAGTVVAFEPVYHRAVLLHRRINRWGNVIICPEAAGEAEGHLQMGIAPANNRGRTSAVDPGRLGQIVTVPVARLDDRLERLGLAHADVIKVDAEGFEMEVLRGAERLLAQRPGPRLVFELSPDFLRAAGHSDVALKRMLAGLGYRLWEIAPAEGRPYVLRRLYPTMPEYRQMDVIALRPEHG